MKRGRKRFSVGYRTSKSKFKYGGFSGRRSKSLDNIKKWAFGKTVGRRTKTTFKKRFNKSRFSKWMSKHK